MHAWRYSLHHSVFFPFCSFRVVSTIKRLPSNNTLVHTCTIFNNSNQRFLRTYSTINLLLSSSSRHNSSDTCTFIIINLHGRYTNSPSGEQWRDKDTTTWSFFHSSLPSIERFCTYIWCISMQVASILNAHRFGSDRWIVAAHEDIYSFQSTNQPCY